MIASLLLPLLAVDTISSLFFEASQPYREDAKMTIACTMNNGTATWRDLLEVVALRFNTNILADDNIVFLDSASIEEGFLQRMLYQQPRIPFRYFDIGHLFPGCI
jgi:hypothetical protein